MATRSKSSGRKKAGASAMKRGKARTGRTGRKAASKRASASLVVTRKSAAKRRPAARKQSPVARVKRVTREVVQQATVAVSAGVETLRDLGGNLVDRVRS